MTDIFVRAGSFLLIIVLGYVLKRVGFFGKDDHRLVSKIVLNVTLPATIIVNFSSTEVEPWLLLMFALGLFGNLVLLAAAMAFGRGADWSTRKLRMLNYPGYSIGCFTLPFAQSFLGPVGVITCSLFDVGNAFVCLGGAFSVAAMVKDGGRFSAKRIVKSLAKSVPFVCYLIMLFLNLTRIPVPGAVVSCARMVADANAFMAMLMIGVGFKLGGDRSQIGRIVKLLSIRYALAAVLALAFYNLLPFDLAVRQALVILVFSPIGSAVPGFTGELKGDVGLSSALNSLSIVISIVIIVTLLSVML